MAMQDVGIRLVVLGVGTFNRDTNLARSTLTGLDRAVEGTSSRLNQIGTNLSRVGQLWTTAITVPILVTTGVLVNAGIQFEDAFAGVSKTVEGVSDNFGVLTADGEILRQQFRALALEIPISVNELARIGEMGGAFGIAKEDLLDFTKTVALLTATTDFSADSASEFIARFGNIMGIAAGDMDDFAKQAGSTVVELGNKFAATEPQIAALALRIAGAGRASGLSTQDILGLAAAVSSMGIEAEMGGSAISRIFNEIKFATDDFLATGEDVTGQFTEFAKVAGYTTEQFAFVAKNAPRAAFVSVVEGLHRMSEEGTLTTGVLKLLNFDTIRLQDVLNRLGPNMSLLNQAIDISNDEWKTQDALQTEAQKKFATTKSQIILLKNAFNDLGIEIFDLYANNIRSLVNGIKSVVTWFRNLDDGVLKSVVKFGLIIAAIGPILAALGAITQLMAVAIGSFSAFSLILPVVIPGMVLLGAILKEKFSPAIKGAIDALQTITGWLGQAYKKGTKLAGKNVFSGISNAFKQLLKIDFKSGLSIFSYFFKSLGMADEDAKKLGDSIQKYLYPFIINLTNGFKQLSYVFNDFKRNLDKVGIAKAISMLFDKQLLVGNVWDTSAFDSVLVSFGVGKETIDGFKRVIDSLVNESWPKLKTFGAGLFSLFSDIASYFVTNVIPVLARVIEWSIVEFLPKLLDVFNTIVVALQSIWDTFEVGGLAGVGQLIKDQILLGLGNLTEWAVANIGIPLMNALLAVDWSQVKQTGLNVLDDIAQGFLNIGGWIKENIVYPFIEWLLTTDWSMVSVAAGHILAGLLLGLVDLYTWVLDHIVTPMLDGIVAAAKDPSTPEKLGKYVTLVLETLAGFMVVMPAWVLENVVVPFTQGLVDGLADGNVIKKIQEFGDKLLDAIVDALSGLGSAIAQMIYDAIPTDISLGKIDLSKYGLGTVDLGSVHIFDRPTPDRGFGGTPQQPSWMPSFMQSQLPAGSSTTSSTRIFSPTISSAPIVDQDKLMQDMSRMYHLSVLAGG